MNKLQSLLATGLLLVSVGAQADLITITGSGGVVDRSTIVRNVNVGTSGAITDVNLTVDFSKCAGNANASGCVGYGGYTYNREIRFWLSHLGNTASIVTAGTFGGEFSRAVRVTQTYDDEAGSTVGGNSLQNGTFRPVGLLSLFDGLDAGGLWRFGFRDTAGGDPLVVHSWTLNITTAATAVPEPGTLALFGLGLLGLGIARRRKSA